MSIYTPINFVAWGHNSNYGSTIERRFDTYGIQYNHTGKFFLKIDDAPPIEVDGSYVFISRPNYLFRYGATVRNTRKHVYATFTLNNLKEYQDNGLLLDEMPRLIKIYDANRFLNAMTDLHNILRKDKNSTLAINLLDRILFIIAEEAQRAEGETLKLSHFHALSSLQQKIICTPQQDWNFENEAKNIGISLAHFRRIFKQVYGVTPNKFLWQCRLNNATQLLIDSDEQIQMIAEITGFSDLYTFSRAFKNYYKISPLQFRYKNQNIS